MSLVRLQVSMAAALGRHFIFTLATVSWLFAPFRAALLFLKPQAWSLKPLRDPGIFTPPDYGSPGSSRVR